MKNTILAILTVCLLALFQGCEKNNGSVPQKHFRIAVVPNGPVGDYWSMAQRGFEFTARALPDVALDFRPPTNSTIEAQQYVLNDLIASGVDGIAISPVYANRQRALLDEIAAKALLVCVDSDAVGSKRACYIGTDNVAAGKQAGGLIKAALPQGGKIVLFVGLTKAQNAIDRIQGIQSALAGSNIQILDTLEDGGKADVALKNAREALANHPDLACMVGLYDYNAPAILTAVREAGRVGQVKIVCFDDTSETMAAITSGDIYGTIVQRPFEMGLRTIVVMEKYLSGDKAILADGRILIPTIAVSTDNLESYQKWHDHRLGR